MLDNDALRVICQKIVDVSKASSRRDTGFLRRSISFTVERNVWIFVEVFYGQFGTNSKLEENARKMMPSGVKWKMRYTEINGSVAEEGEVKTGRTSLGNLVENITKQTSSSVTNLLNRIRGYGKKKDTPTNRLR